MPLCADFGSSLEIVMYLLLVGAAATAYYFTGLRHLVLGQHFDITGGQKTRSNFQGGENMTGWNMHPPTLPMARVGRACEICAPKHQRPVPPCCRVGHRW